MKSLDRFAHEIEARLAVARKEPHWSSAERERYMSEFAPRRKQFNEAASHLITTTISPRLGKLASYFPNAKHSCSPEHGRCMCVFGYCERFSASVTLEISLEHDEPLKELFVRYDLRIAPVPLKYDSHDKLSMPLESVDEDRVAQWIEDRLLVFLATYLQLDRGLDDFEDEVVTDPVCGMRFCRVEASACDEHTGHRYFFCSEGCRQEFLNDPQHYVTLE